MSYSTVVNFYKIPQTSRCKQNQKKTGKPAALAEIAGPYIETRELKNSMNKLLLLVRPIRAKAPLREA